MPQTTQIQHSVPSKPHKSKEIIMNSTEQKSNNTAARQVAETQPDTAQKLNELAQAMFQELGVMCQRRRALEEELTAVDRRISDLNSEIQGVGAALSTIVGKAAQYS